MEGLLFHVPLARDTSVQRQCSWVSAALFRVVAFRISHGIGLRTKKVRSPGMVQSVLVHEPLSISCGTG